MSVHLDLAALSLEVDALGRPRRNARNVVAAWKAGYRLKASSIWTDGLNLWSWRLKIGFTSGVRKFAYDYRGQVSGSTSRHCGLAVAVADVVAEGRPS